MFRHVAVALMLLVATASGTAHADDFVAGNLAVLRATASANNTTASVVEIDTVNVNQTAKQVIAIDGSIFRISGSATSTAYVSRTDDRTLLTFTGVNKLQRPALANARCVLWTQLPRIQARRYARRAQAVRSATKPAPVV